MSGVAIENINQDQDQIIADAVNAIRLSVTSKILQDAHVNRNFFSALAGKLQGFYQSSAHTEQPISPRDASHSHISHSERVCLYCVF